MVRKSYTFSTGIETEKRTQGNTIPNGNTNSDKQHRKKHTAEAANSKIREPIKADTGQIKFRPNEIVDGGINTTNGVSDDRKTVSITEKKNSNDYLNGNTEVVNGVFRDSNIYSNTAGVPKEEIRKILNKPNNMAKEANVNSNRVPYTESPKINGEHKMEEGGITMRTDGHSVRDNGKENKSNGFSVTDGNGTKHKSVIVVSNGTGDTKKKVKTMTDENPDKLQNVDASLEHFNEKETNVIKRSNNTSDYSELDNEMAAEHVDKNQKDNQNLDSFIEQKRDDIRVSIDKNDNMKMTEKLSQEIPYTVSNGDIKLGPVHEEPKYILDSGTKEKKDKKDDDEKIPDISIFQMFRFADKWDKLLLAIGTISAVICGLGIPVNLLVYGRVATGFIYYTIIQDSLSSNTSIHMLLPDDVNPDDYDDIHEYAKRHALYFCLVAIGVLVSGYIQYLCWDISQERQMRTIRKKFFKSVIHSDIAWFDLNHGAELGSSFSESMHALAASLGKEVSVFIQWTVTCVGAYVLALTKGWKVALACMAFSPLIFITGTFLTKWLRTIAAREAKAYAKAGAVVDEVLSSIKTVMAFNGQEKESRRYDKNLKEGGSSSFLKGVAAGFGMGAIWLIMYFVFSTAFGYGIKLMGEKEPGFEPGNVLVIFISILAGSMSLAQAFPSLETFANGKAAAAKIFHTIDRVPVIDSSSDVGEKPTKTKGRLQLKDVCFTYPSRPEVQVLKNFNITVEPGQTIALVGHSGCGKSTVVQLIERFYDTDSGEVLLDGRNIKDLNVAWLRDQIGLVSQEPVLFGTTIKDNIRHGNEDITEEQIKAAAKEANIHNFITTLPEGYNTLVGDRGTQLSGGQKQRIAIARALVRNPKILLLDEATSALDNESEAIVQKALEKAQEGRTTIIIAHRLSTIRNADKIIAIEDGRVIEQGTHNELMKKKGLYHQLVEHQMHHDTETEVVEELNPERTEPEEEKIKHERRASLTSLRSKLEEEKETEAILPKFSMKRLLRLNSPEWLSIAVGCLCSVIVGALQPALAFLMSEFLDVFTKPLDEQTRFTWILIGVVLGIGVANTLLRLFIAICFANAGFKLTMRLRSLTFKSFLRQDMYFFDNPKNNTGILCTRLASDATVVQGATGSKIGYVLESVAVLLSAILVSFLTAWKLAFIVLCFLPLMVGMGAAQAKLTMGFSKKNKGTLEEAGKMVAEVVENIRVVTSLTQEDDFKRKYDEIIDSMCSRAIRRTILTSLLLGASGSVLPFIYAATFTYGSFLVQYEGLRFNLVFRTFAAITFAGMHIGRTSAMNQDFTKAKLAAARLFALMETEPEIDVTKEDGKKPEHFDGRIEFQSVSFKYPSRPDVTVLNDMSFTVSPGETVALVGTSGCGKSTTVSLLERFYDPATGAVMAGSEDITSLNLKWLRSQMGLVSQEPVLFDCSIAENIAYGDNEKDVCMDKIIAAARSANIHEFITSLPEGYDTNVGNKGTQLSGGQKQRIAIARALVSNPKILLLDEATSALDSKSEKIVQQALDQAREGRTCIVIAHRLSTIQNANKIAIIHKGEVVEQGTHSELLAMKGIYYKLIHRKR